jgi:hypothetical protein
MLLSRELWHALHHALPRHPMLWYRLWLAPVRAKPQIRIAWSEAAPAVSFLGGALIVLLLWALIGLNPLALIFLLDTSVCLLIARGISSAIVRARMQGVYDLMGVTPSGMLGATWALTTRALQHAPGTEGLHQTARWIHITWVTMLVPYTFVALLALCSQTSANNGREFTSIFDPLVIFNGFAILLIMVVDYHGSFTAGALVGMVTPSLAGPRLDATLLTPIGVLAVQVLTYGLAVVMQSLLLNVLGVFGGTISSWTVSACFVLGFLVVRELVLLTLCLVVAARLNTSIRDLLTIYRRGI